MSSNPVMFSVLFPSIIGLCELHPGSFTLDISTSINIRDISIRIPFVNHASISISAKIIIIIIIL